MARITRRTILKLSGAGAVAARTGGLAVILATGQAPAFAQAKTVHWLRWADFVPASDQLLKGQITEECQKATGIKLEIETINANDIQARITSSIQSGTGPDIFMTLNNWPQLYAQSCADVGDIADELGKAQGAFTTSARLSRRSMASGSGCLGASAVHSSPTASHGWPRSGLTVSSQPRGINFAPRAKS
jgi:multiple sugar transport system substrate-binding protein